MKKLIGAFSLSLVFLFPPAAFSALEYVDIWPRQFVSVAPDRQSSSLLDSMANARRQMDFLGAVAGKVAIYEVVIPTPAGKKITKVSINASTSGTAALDAVFLCGGLGGLPQPWVMFQLTRDRPQRWWAVPTNFLLLPGQKCWLRVQITDADASFYGARVEYQH